MQAGIPRHVHKSPHSAGLSWEEKKVVSLDLEPLSVCTLVPGPSYIVTYQPRWNKVSNQNKYPLTLVLFQYQYITSFSEIPKMVANVLNQLDSLSCI